MADDRLTEIKARVAGENMNSEQPFRVRSFWSPDRRLLMTVYVTEDDISISDDNGDTYEATGPEENMAESDVKVRLRHEY